MVVLNVRTPNPNVSRSRSPIRLYLVCYEQTQPAPGMKSLRVLSTNLSLGRFRQTFFVSFQIILRCRKRHTERKSKKELKCWTKAWNGPPVIKFALSLSPTLRRVITSAASRVCPSIPPFTFLIRFTYSTLPARPPASRSYIRTLNLF